MTNVQELEYLERNILRWTLSAQDGLLMMEYREAVLAMWRGCLTGDHLSWSKCKRHVKTTRTPSSCSYNTVSAV